MNKNKNENKYKYMIIMLLIVIILMLISGGCTYMKFKNNSTPVMSEYETAVNKITEMSEEDRQAALNQIVEDGMMNVQYAMTATFNGKVSTSFNVKNIENNKYPIIFKLYDENGELIYTSKQIELGYELNAIELDKELSKGTHECRIQIGYVGEGNVSSAFPITLEVN